VGGGGVPDRRLASTGRQDDTSLLRHRRLASPARAFGLSAVVAATSALTAGALVAGASPAAGTPTACSSVNLSVTALHGPNFYIDSDEELFGAYAGYSIADTGSARTDLWVKLTNFNGSVSLGTGQAAANELTSVSVSAGTPRVGGTLTVTVAGETGTIGSGLSNDQQSFWMSPNKVTRLSTPSAIGFTASATPVTPVQQISHAPLPLLSGTY
jgi:hypothetical protein